MDALTHVGNLAQAFIAPGLVVMLFFGADAFVGSAASQALSEAIRDVAARPRDSKWHVALSDFLAEYFPPKGNPRKFMLSVFVLTSISLTFFLTIYTARTAGLFAQLMSKGFILQFLGNGFLVTFAINCIAYMTYRQLLSAFAANSLPRNLLWIAGDFCAKAILFIIFTAIVYVFFAVTTNAFRGSISSALGAVPITIRNALFFQNLTSVYIYSLLLSSLPIFVAFVVKLLVLSPAFASVAQRVLYFLPIAEKPIRAAALIFAFFAALFCVILSALVSPLMK
jgi:hypothetical protein